MSPSNAGAQPLWLPTVASSMAACCTHPLDQTKYRMQILVTKQSMLRNLVGFAARDGIFSLWSGVSASILRQCVYGTTRFGIYNYLAQREKAATGKKDLSTSSMLAFSAVAGGVAGLLANPTEIILVRMCADGAKNTMQRFGYTNALNGVWRVAREEGGQAFFKGLGPNVVRSVLMNVSQIVVYNSVKQQLLSTKRMTFNDDFKTQSLSSFVAGTVATTVCAPADVLKSRMQSAAAVGGRSANLLQVIQHSLKTEGPSFLFKGWTPAWIRLTPNTVLLFLFMEQLKKITMPTLTVVA